jgi:hypothetical protein
VRLPLDDRPWQKRHTRTFPSSKSARANARIDEC